MDIQVRIQWTQTALDGLKALPPKVRQGLLGKADELALADPRAVNKPLVGPLSGYRTMKYSRYRAIYAVEEEPLGEGETLLHLRVLFVAAGIRKEGHKEDVYLLALKLNKLGLLRPAPPDDVERRPT